MPEPSKQVIDDVRQLIRGAGLRATPGRIAVLSQLVDAKGPLTHAEVLQRVADHIADASTIFRALNDMATAGILRRMELGDHVWRYELLNHHHADDGSAHAHFLCVECGEIICLETVDVKPGIAKKGMIHEVTEVLFKGHCTDCG